MLDKYCIVGGKLVSFDYKSCQQEIDMLNRAFFEIMLEGDADGKLLHTLFLLITYTKDLTGIILIMRCYGN